MSREKPAAEVNPPPSTFQEEKPRLAKLGDALKAAAISSRRGYALGKPLSEHDMENEDRFLKSRRGGTVGFCNLSGHSVMLIFSDDSDESAAAVDITEGASVRSVRPARLVQAEEQYAEMRMKNL